MRWGGEDLPDGDHQGGLFDPLLRAPLDGKRQEILIEAVPGLRRTSILADSNTTAVAQLDAPQEAARAKILQINAATFTITPSNPITASPLPG